MKGGLKIKNPMPMDDVSIQKSPLPEIVVLPIYNNKPIAKIGDRVLTGQILAQGEVWTHASISGEIIDISQKHIPHPSHLKTQCITIKSDTKDEWIKLYGNKDWTLSNKDDLLKMIKSAGIVGLGGAGFPTETKIKYTKNCQTIIVNACECEPAVEADNSLMIEYPREILQGVEILLKITGAKNAIIAIEDDKQEAFENLVLFNQNQKISIKQVPTIYGSGSEKSLIDTILKVRVASGKFASEYGILMQNIATIKAIYDAIILGKPLIERVVSDNRNTPYNVLVRIGEVIQGKGVRLGGLMMGIDLRDKTYPILKTTNAIFNSENKKQRIRDCIRCGDCVSVCPAGLLPQQLYWFAKAENIDKCLEYNLLDCTSCRCCDEVCVSNIPLSKYFDFAKLSYKNKQKEQKLAENASARFEFREYRLERNKQEKAEMMARKREEIKKKMQEKQKEKEKADATG